MSCWLLSSWIKRSTYSSDILSLQFLLFWNKISSWWKIPSLQDELLINSKFMNLLNISCYKCSEFSIWTMSCFAICCEKCLWLVYVLLKYLLRSVNHVKLACLIDSLWPSIQSGKKKTEKDIQNQTNDLVNFWFNHIKDTQLMSSFSKMCKYCKIMFHMCCVNTLLIYK